MPAIGDRSLVPYRDATSDAGKCQRNQTHRPEPSHKGLYRLCAVDGMVVIGAVYVHMGEMGPFWWDFSQ